MTSSDDRDEVAGLAIGTADTDDVAVGYGVDAHVGEVCTLDVGGKDCHGVLLRLLELDLVDVIGRSLAFLVPTDAGVVAAVVVGRGEKYRSSSAELIG